MLGSMQRAKQPSFPNFLFLVLSPGHLPTSKKTGIHILQIQLPFEQQWFELHGFTYTWIFFNKYIQYYTMCSSVNLWRWNHGCEGPLWDSRICGFGYMQGPLEPIPYRYWGTIAQANVSATRKILGWPKVHYRKTQTNSLANPIKLRLEFDRQDLPPYFYLFLGQSLIKWLWAKHHARHM